MKNTADRFRALDMAELAKQARDAREQIFRIEFQMAMGQTDGLKKLRVLRKDRARMLTVLGERERNPQAGVISAPQVEAPKPAVKKAPVRKAAAAKSVGQAKKTASAKSRPAAKSQLAAKSKPAAASRKSSAGRVKTGRAKKG